MELVIIRSDRWLFFDEYGLFEANAPEAVRQARTESSAGRAFTGEVDSTLKGGAGRALDRSCSAGRATKGNVAADFSQEPNYVHLSSRSDLVVEEAQSEFYRRAFERKQWQSEVQDAAGGTAGGNHFAIESSLRVKMLIAQRAHAGLSAILDPLLKPPPKGAVKASDTTSQAGYRVATDGVLEKSVSTKGGQAYVPVVPDGDLGTNATWKWWCFLHCPTGIFSGHRLGDQTFELMARIMWWSSMHKEVKRWADECDTCIRFRKEENRNKFPCCPLERTAGKRLWWILKDHVSQGTTKVTRTC